MSKKIIIVLISLIFCGGFLKSQNSFVTESPDNNLKIYVLFEQNELFYRIDYKNKPVILKSSLGITKWENNLSINKVLQNSHDSVWHPVYGERATVRDHFNEKIFVVNEKSMHSNMYLIVRAYNEGIAFRYFFPSFSNSGVSQLNISGEKTTFNVPKNTTCWFAPFAQADYKCLPIKDWPGEAERPLTLRLKNGLYACLAEAEMVDYSRTKFIVKKGEENIIHCKMFDEVRHLTPFATPWRVVMVAEKPADLLANNDIILNLNPSCRIKNTDWIKPGKIIRTVSLTTEGAEKVVDFAAKHKIDYIHFDAGWYGPETSIKSDPRKADVDPQRCKINDLNIPQVVNYAKNKGVGVWVYVNQTGLSQYLDDILPLYQSWGVAGIKFGFVNVGSFQWTKWLHQAVRKCADCHIMVDIHDEYRPTGFSRTFPNLLTQEGIRGNEEFPDGITNTTLPFTRFIAGAADATICYFHRKELKPELAKNPHARFLLNTSCHQMALSVIDYSPLQFLYWYDSPEDVKDVPELRFFDDLPTTWSDTKIVNGQIGEFVTVARKKDNIWFVGAITNNDARKMKVHLDFLDSGKNYLLTLYTDGGDKIKTPTHVDINKIEVTNKSVLRLDILPRGGCAMIIQEKK
ncbi:MAG: glycoside hydrolase family 97 N-terminal domain-containing protein [Bacteroidota bacterium]|nr:glycoside hydrolase family 97 N-terminal domain-containing protein [Bacteroidota bacterium]